jgi:hypothetical protein
MVCHVMVFILMFRWTFHAKKKSSQMAQEQMTQIYMEQGGFKSR